MIRWIFFKLIDMYVRIKPSYADFSIKKKLKYEDGTYQIWYTLNDKPYVFIGKENDYPPVFKPSFSVPIKYASSNGTDITKWVKMCAGPKNILPDPKYIMYSVKWRLVFEIGKSFNYIFERVLVPDEDASINVEDVLNQTRSLGRRLCHQD